MQQPVNNRERKGLTSGGWTIDIQDDSQHFAKGNS